MRARQHPAVAVVVDIDQARSDDSAAAVDGLFGGGLGELADGGHAVAGDAHIGQNAWAARAVYDSATAEEQVEHNVSTLRNNRLRDGSGPAKL